MRAHFRRQRSPGVAICEQCVAERFEICGMNLGEGWYGSAQESDLSQYLLVTPNTGPSKLTFPWRDSGDRRKRAFPVVSVSTAVMGR